MAAQPGFALRPQGPRRTNCRSKGNVGGPQHVRRLQQGLFEKVEGLAPGADPADSTAAGKNTIDGLGVPLLRARQQKETWLQHTPDGAVETATLPPSMAVDAWAGSRPVVPYRRISRRFSEPGRRLTDPWLESGGASASRGATANDRRWLPRSHRLSRLVLRAEALARSAVFLLLHGQPHHHPMNPSWQGAGCPPPQANFLRPEIPITFAIRVANAHPVGDRAPD